MPIYFSQRLRCPAIRVLLLAGFLDGFAPAASAQGPNEGIHGLLKALEKALSDRNVEEVSALYEGQTMPRAEQEALQRYFNHVAELRVRLSNPEISVTGGTGRAEFLREDEFKDRDGEKSKLEVRLVADLVRSDGGWKISGRLRKAS